MSILFRKLVLASWAILILTGNANATGVDNFKSILLACINLKPDAVLMDLWSDGASACAYEAKGYLKALNEGNDGFGIRKAQDAISFLIDHESILQKKLNFDDTYIEEAKKFLRTF